MPGFGLREGLLVDPSESSSEAVAPLVVWLFRLDNLEQEP